MKKYIFITILIIVQNAQVQSSQAAESTSTSQAKSYLDQHIDIHKFSTELATIEDRARGQLQQLQHKYQQKKVQVLEILENEYQQELTAMSNLFTEKTTELHSKLKQVFRIATDHNDTKNLNILMQHHEHIDLQTLGFALRGAAQHGYEDVLKILMQHPNFDQIDLSDFGFALTTATKHSHENVVQILKQKIREINSNLLN